LPVLIDESLPVELADDCLAAMPLPSTIKVGYVFEMAFCCAPPWMRASMSF
jgi:hypothetical protein